MAGSYGGSDDSSKSMVDFAFPPGPLPNGDRGPAINAVQVLMIILATTSVIMRFIARRMSAAGLWWDDWVILGALVWVESWTLIIMWALQLTSCDRSFPWASTS